MTAPATAVQCEDCHRPLKDPASIARGRGRICQAVFEGDTHISPVPRRPSRRRNPDQILLPLENPVDAETRKAAIDVIARHALHLNVAWAVASQIVDWGQYPELDEADFDAVCARVLAIAQSIRSADEQYQAAYEHLTNAPADRATPVSAGGQATSSTT
jgi:hypothetical protein